MSSSTKIEGTVVLEATRDLQSLDSKLRESLYGPDSHRHITIVLCRETDREFLGQFVSRYFRDTLVISPPSGTSDPTQSWILSKVTTDRLGFLPEKASFSNPDWSRIYPKSRQISPWISETKPPDSGRLYHSDKIHGWLITTDLLSSILPTNLDQWPLLSVNEFTQLNDVNWLSGKAFTSQHLRESELRHPEIDLSSRIAVVIPHYNCETWLPQCLFCMVHQSRRPDAIFVIDDGSPTPPLELVSQFPSVTLLRSSKNVGPYGCVQSVIDCTDFDGYLFQDADDWSSSDRLQLLLQEAERTGSQMIGSQEVRIVTTDKETYLQPVLYPLNASDSYRLTQSNSLLHPASLVSRNFLQRLHGFSTGLRFGADEEFLQRAACVGTIRNVPSFCYFRRKRANSLTTSPDTGINSVARNQLIEILSKRSAVHKKKILLNEAIDVDPYLRVDPPHLVHISGPRVGGF